MELTPEIKDLINGIIDLVKVDEKVKQDMREDSDVYLVSLLLQLRKALQKGTILSSLATNAMYPHLVIEAQKIVGKDKTTRGIERQCLAEKILRPSDPIQPSVAEKLARYSRHKKRKTA